MDDQILRANEIAFRTVRRSTGRIIVEERAERGTPTRITCRVLRCSEVSSRPVRHIRGQDAVEVHDRPGDAAVVFVRRASRPVPRGERAAEPEHVGNAVVSEEK